MDDAATGSISNSVEPTRSKRRGRTARWVELATVTTVAVALAVAAGIDLGLRVGPTRTAECRGKRVAHPFQPDQRRYRVSYTYDDGGRRASDTDSVNPAFFQTVRKGTPLRVRTFGVGTFRFARLADGASDRRDDWTVAARWTGVTTAGMLWVPIRLRRHRRHRRHRRAAGLPT